MCTKDKLEQKAENSRYGRGVFVVGEIKSARAHIHGCSHQNRTPSSARLFGKELTREAGEMGLLLRLRIAA